MNPLAMISIAAVERVGFPGIAACCRRG